MAQQADLAPAPSSDPVTELQTCLDQIATQFYASIRYITTHHPVTPPASGPPPSNLPTASSQRPGPAPAPVPSSAVPTGSATAAATGAEAALPPAPYSPSHTPVPDAADFTESTRELARDLVLKQKQIEGLIAQLPEDLEQAEREQEERMRVLEGKLRETETASAQRWEERERLLEQVDTAIGKCKRVV